MERAALLLPILAAIMLASSVWRSNMGIMLMLGGLFFGLIVMPFPEVLRVLFKTLTDLMCLEVILASMMIAILGMCVKEAGQLNAMIDGLKCMGLHGRQIIALAASGMGLLPMPGAAILSAPVVDEEGNAIGLSPRKKAFANVWFRHIVFLVYPLVPSIILISSVFGYSIHEIILYQLPMAACYLVMGYLFTSHPKKRVDAPIDVSLNAVRSFIIGISPIIIVPLLIMSLGLPIAILAGILLSITLGRIKLREAVRLVRMAKPWDLGLIFLGIMFLKDVILASGISKLIVHALIRQAINEHILVGMSSFAAGFIIGVPLGAVGLMCPTLMELKAKFPSIILAHLASILGSIPSPVHPCFIVTSKFFKLKLSDTFPYLLLASTILLLICIAFYTIMDLI